MERQVSDAARRAEKRAVGKLRYLERDIEDETKDSKGYFGGFLSGNRAK